MDYLKYIAVGLLIGGGIVMLWVTIASFGKRKLAEKTQVNSLLVLLLAAGTIFGSLRAEDLLLRVFELPPARGATLATLVWIFCWALVVIYFLRVVLKEQKRIEAEGK